VLNTSPTFDSVMVKVRAFLLSVVAPGVPVLRGPINRAAQPVGSHVIFTPLFQKRLRTNLHVDDPDYDATTMEQGTEVRVQFDFYGNSAADACVAASTAWRDQYGVDILSPEAVPLYTDVARMVPLVTGEEQFLERFVLTAVLQWNPVATVPQQFAEAASVELVNVDVEYPPT
jgi:hypothetical protein